MKRAKRSETPPPSTSFPIHKQMERLNKLQAMIHEMNQRSIELQREITTQAQEEGLSVPAFRLSKRPRGNLLKARVCFLFLATRGGSLEGLLNPKQLNFLSLLIAQLIDVAEGGANHRADDVLQKCRITHNAILLEFSRLLAVSATAKSPKRKSELDRDSEFLREIGILPEGPRGE